jgi:IS30 family transposase
MSENSAESQSQMLLNPRTTKRRIRLTFDNRQAIEEGLHKQLSMYRIAKQLKRNASTINREINNNGGVTNYSAKQAQARALKYRMKPELIAEVEKLLKEKKPYREISVLTGVSYVTINNIVKKAGGASVFGRYGQHEKRNRERDDKIINLHDANYADLERKLENLQQQIDIVFDVLKELRNGKN